MNDEKKPQAATPSISVEHLAAAFAAAMKSSQPTAGMLTGMSEERLERVQGKHDKPLRQRVIAGRSEDTGSTFDMVIVESRTDPRGRLLRLENYKLSPSVYRRVSEGGLLPDGAIVWQDPKNQTELNDRTPSHMLSTSFKSWRTNEIWIPDLRRMVSKAPRAEWCVNPKDLETVQWETTRMFEDKAAE